MKAGPYDLLAVRDFQRREGIDLIDRNAQRRVIVRAFRVNDGR
jgi:hypothetical protein